MQGAEARARESALRLCSRGQKGGLLLLLLEGLPGDLKGRGILQGGSLLLGSSMLLDNSLLQGVGWQGAFW